MASDTQEGYHVDEITRQQRCAERAEMEICPQNGITCFVNGGGDDVEAYGEQSPRTPCPFVMSNEHELTHAISATRVNSTRCGGESG